MKIIIFYRSAYLGNILGYGHIFFKKNIFKIYTFYKMQLYSKETKYLDRYMFRKCALIYWLIINY